MLMSTFKSTLRMARLTSPGYFPLEDIVHIDPDNFKRAMPEWDGYVRRTDKAGDLTHRESAFMQEIAQEVAMRHSQNIWIDGTLRDGSWFAQVFGGLRRDHPRARAAWQHEPQ